MKRFLAIILTAVFATQIACITLCIHTHVVDGRIVTHAHPYSNTQHQHSDTSIAAFSHVLHSLFASQPNQSSISAFFVFLAEINIYTTEVVSLSVAHILADRAPPVR